ncbi:MAG TPA: hypothetical protein VFU10_02385 [Gaiellaceae bacterium]|nr:hypothetical protein [Gaiellaceae bacterium]
MELDCLSLPTAPGAAIRGASAFAIERRTMRKSLFAIIALAGLLAFGALTASATSGAHFFHKASKSTVNNQGALVVSWDEAGVGQDQVNYILSADASATYACINGGGNHPQASNKETFNGPLSSPETGFLPENGRVQGTLSVGPLSSGNFSCPNGQQLVLACVSYTNITLTDTTNGVTETFADTSRVFIQGVC